VARRQGLGPIGGCPGREATRAITLAGAVSLTVAIGGSPGNDLDLYFVRDNNANGVWDATDTTLGSSTGATDVESLSFLLPADGTYLIAVHGWSVPAGSTTFTLTVTLLAVPPGVVPVTATNLPATVPANSASSFRMAWNLPAATADGVQSFAFFMSPGNAPLALAMLVPFSLRIDRVAPTAEVSPVHASFIRDAMVPVVVNILDATVRQIDRFSPALTIDGVDVTSVSKLLAPFDNGYALVTVAWEHTVPLGQGAHTARITARDQAGNQLTSQWTFVVDSAAPGIAVTSPAGDGFTNTASLAYEAWTEPSAVVDLTRNGVPVTASIDAAGRVSAVVTLVAGANELVLTSTDSLGNAASVARTVVLDTTNPVISATADVRSPTNARSTTISGRVTEAVETVWVNDAPIAVGTDGTFSAVVALAEGSNVVTIVTWDAAGNQGTASMPPIERDTAPPSITMTAPPSRITDLNVQTVTIGGTVPDDDVFFVTVNGQPVARTPSGAFSREFDLAVGDNVFVVQAQDDAGNVASATVSVLYSPVIVQERANYNSIIASGVAVVLLIVGFVVGYLLSGRGGGPATPVEMPGGLPKKEGRAEEELPGEQAPPVEEEEL